MPKEKDTAAPKRSLADLRAAFGRPRQVVDLYLDGAAVAEAEALEEQFQRAAEADELTNGPDEAPAIAQRAAEARGRAEASRVPFTLVALSHRDWAALIAKHPPTQEQLDAAPVGSKPDYNIDSLPGELVMLQLQDPDPGTPEGWADFWDGLSDGQVRALWRGAQFAQLGDGALGKSVLPSVARLSSDGS